MKWAAKLELSTKVRANGKRREIEWKKRVLSGRAEEQATRAARRDVDTKRTRRRQSEQKYQRDTRGVKKSNGPNTNEGSRRKNAVVREVAKELSAV